MMSTTMPQSSTIPLTLQGIQNIKHIFFQFYSLEYLRLFLRYRIVQSSTLSGTPVITVRATDRDHGRNGRITYQVARNPYFKMLPTRGTIVLKRPLDRDAKDMMEITVTAVDHGIPSLQTSARVEISFADRNDHVPTFDEKLYTLSVAENSPVGHVVGNVRAVDEDKGKNGDIEYRLRTPIKKFKIETGTGKIE